MIVEIRGKQTLRGTGPNKRLPIMNCAQYAFDELALHFLLFLLPCPRLPSIVIHLRRGKLKYEKSQTRPAWRSENLVKSIKHVVQF